MSSQEQGPSREGGNASALAAPSPLNAPSARGAMREGLIVLIASLIGHLGNFLFYVVAARSLDPGEFAALASLTSLALIVLTPISGVQAAMARDVAQSRARGDGNDVTAMIRWLFCRVLVVQVALFALFAAITPVSSYLFGLSQPTVWLLAAIWFALATGVQALLGPIQGFSGFPTVGWVLAGPLGILRLLFLFPLVLLLGLHGALLALILATLVGSATVLWSLRGTLRPIRGLTRARHPGDPTHLLGLPVGCLLAFAAITNIDIVTAKIRLAPEVAATYSSAALLGKVALYATVSLGFVLLPKVSERITRGLDYAKATLLTLLTVVGVGLLTATTFLLASDRLIVAIFGSAYAQAGNLIFPITLIMTGAGILNVHLTIAIAARDRGFGFAFVGLAVIHFAALLVFGKSTGMLIAANAIVIGSAITLIELFSTHGVVRMLVRLRIPEGQSRRRTTAQ